MFCQLSGIMKKSAGHLHVTKFDKFTSKYKPILFDVSLRDGIQPCSVDDYTLEIKQSLFSKIMEQHPIPPQKIEVGSLASPKVLPIMANSMEMYNYATEKVNISGKNVDIYMLVPSITKAYHAISGGVSNMSFITSVSNAFQLKNTNKTLDETKHDFKLLEDILPHHINKKLYISCINECPISGVIPTYNIIKEIVHYSTHYNFDELCLSDTCGSLTGIAFSNIVRDLIYFGVPVSKLSLHLHVKNIDEIEAIVFKCIECGINKFDVSMLETGGCSVTITDENMHKLNRNLSYGDLYFIFQKWCRHHIT